MYDYDSSLGSLRLIPNITGYVQNADVSFNVVANSEGFRDVERTGSLSPDLVLVGDSFLFSHTNTEDMISSSIRKLMGSRYVVESYGVSSYDPRDYRNIVRMVLARETPKHIVVFFYLGNDIKNLSGNREFIIYQGYLVSQNISQSFFQQLKFKSILFIKRYIKSHAFFYQQYLRLLDTDVKRNEVVLAARHLTNTSQQRSFVVEAVSYLQEIHEMIGNQTQLTVVLLPQKVQVLDPKRFTDIFSSIDPEKQDALFPEQQFLRQTVITHLTANDIPFIDASPVLALDPDAYYYPQDIHLTPAGNQVVSQFVAQYLLGTATPVNTSTII